MTQPDDDELATAPVRVRRLGSFQSQMQARAWGREQRRREADAAHARLTVWTAWLAGGALAVSALRILAGLWIG